MGSSDELFAAIDAGDVDVVRSLIGADAAIATGRDAEGVSSLMRARYRSDTEIIGAILAAAPALDVFEAAAFENLDRLAELLMADAPLHAAAMNGNRELVELLLVHGADPAATNDDGATVLALAEGKGDAVAVARIRQALG